MSSWFWLDDLVVLALVVVATSAYLMLSLFAKSQSTFAFWEKIAVQRALGEDATRSVDAIDHHLLMQQVEERHQLATKGAPASSTDNTTFVLSEFSLPVCRSLWRIVEYVLSDFVDFWWIKISDTPDFGNDLRDVFDHAFNVLGERCIKIDWSPFIVKNVISNLNYLMRIYRLTEQELITHNPFFTNTPEAARHRLIKAELMRTYKLHVAVANPQAYLRKLSTAVLSQLLRSSDFRSETVRTLTREILTTFVFVPVMNFVDPYWLNLALLNFLQKMQAEREGAAEKEAAAPEQLTKPTSRGNSPTRRGAFSMTLGQPPSVLSTAEEANFSTFRPSMERVSSTTGHRRSLDDSFLPAGYVAQRKDTLLTQKMQQWEGEKAKRQTKKNSRHHTLGAGGRSSGGSGEHHPLVRSSSLSGEHGRPHDDDVPTGLFSPSGAFSHSPNHGTSPLSSTAPHPSQLSTNWEVRIIGAGIRFDPKPFVMYQLLVKNGEAFKWTVVKRYGKFEELHQRLKKAIPSFDAQLPKKAFFGNLDQQFIQNRKVELQTYLGQLLWNKNVHSSADLQEFLLPSAEDAKWAQAGANGAAGNGTASSFTTPSTNFFGGASNKKSEETRTLSQPSAIAHDAPPPLIHQQSLPVHSSASVLQQAADVDGSAFDSPPLQPYSNSQPRLQAVMENTDVAKPSSTLASNDTPPSTLTLKVSPPTSPLHKPPQVARTYSADDISSSPSQPQRSQSQQQAPAPMPFSQSSLFSTNWDDKQLTDPLYLLVEEIFNLNGRGWVSRQATWVGKQLVKITMDTLIKNQLNKQVDSMLNETALTEQIDWVTSLIWPDGKLFVKKPPVTAEEKETVKAEAQRMLVDSIPTTLRTLLGKEHCVTAMEKCFAFLQMEPLCLHFAYSVLDSLVLELFPDLTHVLGR